MGAMQPPPPWLSAEGIGERIYGLAAEIYPICRSITGPGLRETLSILAGTVPMDVRSVATGTPVLDWTVPREWTIRDAWVKNAAGERVIDFRAHNLHVMGYSAPVRAVMPLAELKRHVFTMPDQPDVIPYRTGYYSEGWAFCASHNLVESLPDGDYEVMIDSTLADGVLNYGEYVHQGESEAEFLLTTTACHPSLANDNCSGMALLAHLAAALRGVRTRYTYRFLWMPATIGAIAWLARNDDRVSRIRHGLVVSCVGDAGGPTYKRTVRGDAPIDKVMEHVLRHAPGTPKAIDFFPYGYDERQFSSPGYRLDVGLFQRSLFGSFPEYHTSADNLDFITPGNLAESYEMVASAIEIVETDGFFLNTAPKGEPQLGRRGLYDKFGGQQNVAESKMAMLWLLSLSDGRHSLLDIAERAGIRFSTIAATARILRSSGLLVEAPAGAADPAGAG
jgi:aminopeptidase-like protein